MYAASLAASLAKSAASALGGGGGGSDGNDGGGGGCGGRGVAGPLSVAAASLRFVAVAVVTAATTPSETAQTAAPLGSRRPFDGQSTATEGGGDGPQSQAPRPWSNQRRQRKLDERRKSLGQLLEVLWASGCLEACVQVVGEAAPREASTVGG